MPTVNPEATTPRENLAAATAKMREHLWWSSYVRTTVDAAEQMSTWIRANRGRLHKATCLDGQGCRCGLIDLPIWGGADGNVE